MDMVVAEDDLRFCAVDATLSQQEAVADLLARPKVVPQVP
jgi:hypothetical protein